MKGIILAVLLATLPIVSDAQEEECWQEGYQKGWCDAQDKMRDMCLPPMPPLPPLAELGREDCQSRFADGYKKGTQDGS